jgi:inorganic phosphate transporter, PiT family
VILELLALTIALAIIFDFINGFHDSANAISTVVATRVLKPWQAVTVAGVANFIGPFIFGVAVAKAVQGDILHFGKDAVLFVNAELGLLVVLAGLLGAIVWNLLTWRWGIPSSSSHALLGGLVGAGLAAAGLGVVKWPAGDQVMIFLRVAATLVAAGVLAGLAISLLSKESNRRVAMFFGGYVGLAAAAVWTVIDPKAIAAPDWLPHANLGTVGKTVLFMAVSPFLGFLSAFVMSLLLMSIFRKARYGSVNRGFGVLQVASSAFYSLTHGTNDGQKTMGVIAGALALAGIGASQIPGGEYGTTQIPMLVVFVAAAAIGVGTMFGGWRIVKTMATKITDLQPYQGFAAETGGGVALWFMANNGIPVSTTHAISGSIMGVGATRSMSAVQWGVARRIVMAWIITIPASAGVAAAVLLVLRPLLGV